MIAAALSEALALAAGGEARVRRLEVELVDGAPVGAFLDVEAHAKDGRADATASVDGREVARANGLVG